MSIATRKACEVRVCNTSVPVKLSALTGEAIRKLAHPDFPADCELIVACPGKPDQLVEDKDEIVLKDGQHFLARPKSTPKKPAPLAIDHKPDAPAPHAAIVPAPAKTP